jgi:hypothetical protein
MGANDLSFSKRPFTTNHIPGIIQLDFRQFDGVEP